MLHVSVAHSHSQPFEKMTGRTVFTGCNHDSLSISMLAVSQPTLPVPNCAFLFPCGTFLIVG